MKGGRFPIMKIAHLRTLGQKAGFTLLEMLVVLLIICVMTVIALPSVKAALQSYDLGAAVQAVSGAIQSTRYLSISQGVPYNIAFDQTTLSYQVGVKLPPGTTFSNAGNPVQWLTSSGVSLSPSTTFEFSPGGTVKATTGTMSLTLTNGTTIETITVSEVGNISVTP